MASEGWVRTTIATRPRVISNCMNNTAKVSTDVHECI